MYQTKGPGDIEQAKHPEGRIDGKTGPIVYSLTPLSLQYVIQDGRWFGEVMKKIADTGSKNQR